jgi:hypothetical protein
MKFVLSVMLFAICARPLLAQKANATVQNACGPEKTWFEVELDSSKHSVTQPEDGKARVYFLHDAAGSNLTRVGIDGAWAGALRDGSWFSVSVSPGEHHFCASHQSHFSSARYTELLHFTAEANKVYYLRIRYLSDGGKSGGWEGIQFDKIDSDQGEYLIGTRPMARWCLGINCNVKY